MPWNLQECSDKYNVVPETQRRRSKCCICICRFPCLKWQVSNLAQPYLHLSFNTKHHHYPQLMITQIISLLCIFCCSCFRIFFSFWCLLSLMNQHKHWEIYDTFCLDGFRNNNTIFFPTITKITWYWSRNDIVKIHWMCLFYYK